MTCKLTGGKNHADPVRIRLILQQRLDNHRWLAADQITVADIAVYPYIALAQEGKIDFEPYPAIIAWINRIQALSGYVGMPGMRQSE